MDATNNATVSFKSLKGVPDTGVLSVEWPVSGDDTVGKDASLKDLILGPLSGKIVRFEPSE